MLLLSTGVRAFHVLIKERNIILEAEQQIAVSITGGCMTDNEIMEKVCKLLGDYTICANIKSLERRYRKVLDEESVNDVLAEYLVKWVKKEILKGENYESTH